jgi:hypothetical protein
MSITINPEIESLVRELALARGMEPDALVNDVLERACTYDRGS